MLCFWLFVYFLQALSHHGSKEAQMCGDFCSTVLITMYQHLAEFNCVFANFISERHQLCASEKAKRIKIKQSPGRVLVFQIFTLKWAQSVEMLQDLEQSRAEPADPKRHAPLCSILTIWLIDFHCCPEEVWHFCSSRLVILHLLLLLSFLHFFFVSELQGSGPGHHAHGEQLVFVPLLLQLPLLVPANAHSSLIYSRSTLTLALRSCSIVPAALMEGWFLFLSPPFSFVFLFSLLIATTGALLCGTRDCEPLISFKTFVDPSQSAWVPLRKICLNQNCELYRRWVGFTCNLDEEKTPTDQ